MCILNMLCVVIAFLGSTCSGPQIWPMIECKFPGRLVPSAVCPLQTEQYTGVDHQIDWAFVPEELGGALSGGDDSGIDCW